MVETIWGGSPVGLALAALKSQYKAMKRLELDMIGLDKPGFTKTIQESSIHYSGGQAIGIDEGAIKEATDSGAENELRYLAAQVNKNEELAKYIGNYQKALGQTEDDCAFLRTGNKIVVAINAACSQGGDSPINKKAVLDAIADHTKQINILANKLQNLRNSASEELANQIPSINQLLVDIAATNANMDPSTPEQNISYSRQQRVLLDQLAEHMQINVQQGNGSDFLVYTSSGRVLVQGSLAAKFIYTPPAAIDTSQTFTSGIITLQSIASDASNLESPSTGTDAPSGYPSDQNYYDRRTEAFIFDVTKDFANTSGGAISGLMSFLQSDSITFGQSLDAYAAGLRDSFNELHNLGSAIQPRATLRSSAPGYIGGSALSGDTAIQGAGTLRIAVINTSTNLATLSADIDLSSITDVDSLCGFINNDSTLQGHVFANVTNGSLQIATRDTNCGISLGCSNTSATPTIRTSEESIPYGFSEFFHLNDVLTTSPNFWRGGGITGLASSIRVDDTILANPQFFSLNQLRDNALGNAQAVSGDMNIGRQMSDLFTRTKIQFQTPSGETIKQTLEEFSKGLVEHVEGSTNNLHQEIEGDKEAYKQEKTLFQSEFGMNEQEIAIRSMQISKSQDLYFAFLNQYWRMMSRVAEMGQ